MRWERLKISDFSQVITGGTPSTSKKEYWENGSIPWLNSGELNQNIIETCENKITELGLQNSSSRIMPPDTVLIALTGTTTGVVGYLTFEACANQSVTGILPSPKHHPKYLYYYLKSIRSKILEESYGGAQKHISQGYVKDLEIPLPPLETQKRIANILDAADSLRQKDQELLKKYDELAQSIFIDMFGDPVKNEKRWDVKKLDEVCLKITDGTHDTPERITEGVKFITGKHIRPYFIDYDNSDYVTTEIHAEIYRRCNPEFGDVLYTNIGVNYATAAMNTVNYEFSMKNVALLKYNRELLAGRFLEYQLNNEYFKERLKTITGIGGAQQFLSLAQIKSIKLLIPPLKMQQIFEGKINTLFASVRKEKHSIGLSTNLFNSLIQKAFQGKLI